MASIFVTGSTAGIGLETARTLVTTGHRVVLHARDKVRAAEAGEAVPGASAVVVGDLASLDQTRELAAAAQAQGPYDVVIHNAGVGGGTRPRQTDSGANRILQVNVLAPYVLTALMGRPARLIYLTSGLQDQGVVVMEELRRGRLGRDGMQAYCDSKMYDVALALAVSRLWPGVLTHAVDPGWVKTRMGGPGAPDSVALGAETQIRLATSDDPAAPVTGRYWKRGQEMKVNPAVLGAAVQDEFLEICGSLSGVPFPGNGTGGR